MSLFGGERVGERGRNSALVTARGLLRANRSRTENSDLAYAFYIGVMLTIIVVAPVVRAAVLGLEAALTGVGSPGSVLTTDVATGLVAALAVGISGLLVLAAAHTGPAHATLPDLDLLVAGPFTRGRVLGRPVTQVLGIAAILGAGVGALFAGAWTLVSGPDVESWVALLLVGATAGLLASVAMLAGQISRRVRGFIVGLLALLVLLHLLAALGMLPGGSIPGPWSVFAVAALTPGSDGTLIAAAAWCVSVLALTALVPWMLGRLSHMTLRAQSLSMNAVSALAVSGDLRMAAELLGAPVRMGRGLRWRPAAKAGLAFAVRDFIGLVRTPARSLAAFVGVAAMGAVLGATDPQAIGPLWAAVIGAVCVTFVYAAIGPWCRGFRAASQTLGGMALLPQSPAVLIARHAVVPGVLVVAVTSSAAGTVAVIIAGALGPVLIPALAYGAVVGILALLFRVLGALKGPLPQQLLAPVPTPAGDMAGLNVLLWTIDGVVWAIIAGAILGALVAVATPAAIIASVVFMVALSAWSVTRLRSTSI